jgi:S1-C subfamily serine protease
MIRRLATGLLLSATLTLPLLPSVALAADQTAAKAELRQIASEANKLSRAFNLVHEIVGPSVVSIHTKETVRVADVWGRVARREVDVGEGSGFVIHSDDKASYILTNSHVVLQTNQNQEFVTDAQGHPVGYDKVKVSFNDGRDADASYVGCYPQSDVAVIKVSIPNLPAVEWADSDQARVGDWVVALGYPLAVGYSATAGIVSATDRSTGIYRSRMLGGFDSFLQTDAAINPGNSGGPLVDLYGHVVGVNSNIISRSGGNIGLGFAIPSNHVRRIADDLIKYGRVHRSVIGIQLDQTDDEARIAGIIPDSPAAKAGLETGDVVTAVDQYRITSASQFQSRISSYRIGQPIPLTIQRGEGTARKALTITVTPVGEDELAGKLDQAAAATAKRAGVQLPNFGVALAADRRTGLVITALDPDGVFAAAGLEPGDRVLREKTLGHLRTTDDALKLERLREITIQVDKDGRSYWVRMRR